MDVGTVAVTFASLAVLAVVIWIVIDVLRNR